MNLKEYFRAVEEQEAAIEDAFVLTVSLPTPNGGKAGVVSEVNRTTAAKLLVEGKARLATPEEVAQVRQEREAKRRQRDLEVLQERIRMSRLAEVELETLKNALKATENEQ